MSEFLDPSEVAAAYQNRKDDAEWFEFLLAHIVDVIAADWWVSVSRFDAQQTSRLAGAILRALNTDPRVDQLVDSGVPRTQYDPKTKEIIRLGETIKEPISLKLDAVLKSLK
jgi:hypothetical protein